MFQGMLQMIGVPGGAATAWFVALPELLGGLALIAGALVPIVAVLLALELAAIPLALVAGVFGVLSPCVWPLVPVVTSSAATSGRSGPLYLAAGLSVSFAVAGPTLGAAIALASMGQSMSMAFVVMLAYGIGTAGVLLLAGVVSSRVLARWRPGMMSAGGLGKKVLGATLLVLGLLVLTGMDKYLEAFAVSLVPEWVYSL
jgi:cytochrome c biogenesis protein CcdA